MNHRPSAPLLDRATVVVVGAGPAGSTTALLLARAGIDVLLVDRRDFPRSKPCGECLSPEAGRLLDRLGLLSPVLDAAPARLAGWRIFAPAGHSFEGTFDTICGGDARVASALAISRDRLDHVLLEAARRAGARTRTDLIVHGIAPSSHGIAGHTREGAPFRIEARLVVGADGLRSTIAAAIAAPRRPPRLRKLSLTAHVTGLRDAGAYGEMHLADAACAGIAPVESGPDPLHNLTIVVRSDRFGRDVAASTPRFFERALTWFPALAPRVPGLRFTRNGATDEGPVRLLASGPFDRPVRRTTADGIALVGDAAGYFDPFTGQGICHALSGAELLARVAIPALAAKDVSDRRLAAYGRARRRFDTPARLLQRAIELVLLHPGCADAAIRRLARKPDVVNALLAATGDLASPLALLSPRLLLSFAAPVSRTGFG